jgi:hypothetical protein
MDTLPLTTKPSPLAPPAIRLGVWRSLYHYPSRTRGGIFAGEHYMQMHKTSRYLIAESLPGSKSYVLIRLTLQDNVATGSWHEQTDPEGHYQGATYHGAIQLVVGDDGKEMSGKWVGFGKHLDVNVGDWELKFYGDEPPM